MYVCIYCIRQRNLLSITVVQEIFGVISVQYICGFSCFHHSKCQMLNIYLEGFLLLSDNIKLAKITALSDKTFRFQSGRYSLITVYMGRLRRKGVPSLFKLQIFERVAGISPVQVYERGQKTITSVCKNTQGYRRTLSIILWRYNVDKIFQFCALFIFIRHSASTGGVKRDAKFILNQVFERATIC